MFRPTAHVVSYHDANFTSSLYSLHDAFIVAKCKVRDRMKFSVALLRCLLSEVGADDPVLTFYVCLTIHRVLHLVR